MLAAAGLLLGSGCVAAVSPGERDAEDHALLSAWLIPEVEEAHHAPEIEAVRDRRPGGGRFDLDDGLDPSDLSGGEDFIVLEGVPEPHGPTPVAIYVTSVEVRTFGGRAYAAVYVAADATNASDANAPTGTDAERADATDATGAEPADAESAAGADANDAMPPDADAEPAGPAPGPADPADTKPDRIAGLFPLEPVPATAPAATGFGPIGLWVTGAPFRNWSDGGSYRGEGVWRQVKPGAVGDDGVSCAGPTADEMTPHVYPECLGLHLVDDSARHSPVYGFAADGYPVHGPWADLELPARSSWRLRDYSTAGSATGCAEAGRRTCLLADPLDPAAGTVPAPAPGPDTADVPAGAFFEDYWFDVGLDDGSPQALDAFNGHTHDDAGHHDDLGYHYHITRIQNPDGTFTDVFPYIVGPWFRGELHPGALNAGGPRLAEDAITGRPTEPDEPDGLSDPTPPPEPPALCVPRVELCD